MEKRVWCLAVVVAVSGCGTPKGMYAALTEESLKARTLEEAVKASRPRRIKVGRELKLKLEKSDDILLTSEGAPPDLYYVSYYRLYSFMAVAGTDYTITVRSFCDCLGFQKLVAVPEAYVVDREGRLVSGVLHPVNQDGSKGELVGTWGFAAEKNDKYFLVLAANNVDPGRWVGEVKGYLYNQRSYSTQEMTMPLQSSTTGFMALEIKEL